MTESEHYVEYFKSCISTARRISFALAAFSIAAIYIGVIGNAAQRSKVEALEGQRKSLTGELSEFNHVLAEVRAFYEGPAEAESLNFASQIYSLKNTREFVAEMRRNADSFQLNPADRSFFDFQATLIAHNAFELQNILGGLIQQKENRIPFDKLPFSDLLDLDYHKGKDAWQIYYEWSAMRYALYRQSDYGFSQYPEADAPLERRFQYFVRTGEESRGASTKPKAVGRTQALVDQITTLSEKGFRSLGDIKARLAALDRQIEQAKKALSGSIKMPFLEQNIEVTALVWLVPLTITFSLLFELYYVRKAQVIAEKIMRIDDEVAGTLNTYPWLLLDQQQRSVGHSAMVASLRILIVGAPVAVSAVLAATSADTSLVLMAIGGGLTIAAAIATVLLIREVRSFSRGMTETSSL